MPKRKASEGVKQATRAVRGSRRRERGEAAPTNSDDERGAPGPSNNTPAAAATNDMASNDAIMLQVLQEMRQQREERARDRRELEAL